MSKLAFGVLTAAMGGIALIASPPAQAQGTQGEVLVYGEDPCPRSTDDEVVICRRLPESERFRIPEELRAIDRQTDPANQSWAARVKYLEENNVTGIAQCSATGPAGMDGCLQKQIDQSFERREALEEDETAPE